VIEILFIFKTTLYDPELAYTTLTELDDVDVAGDPPLKVH
jgi:hypothetical protein